MSNFDANKQESIAKFILENLGRHDTMALATVDEQGLPWVVCVNLSYDKAINFMWKSAMASEHSKYIQNNHHVGICVFSHSDEVGDFGFYTKAIVHEVSDAAELNKAIEVKYTQKNLEIPPVSDFIDTSTRRMYCAVISEAWINDERHIKTPVDLAILRKMAQAE